MNVTTVAKDTHLLSEHRSKHTQGYDAIVIGLGAMGSATLFHLARRGLRALGLEQFSQGHQLGSSHGDSRIIRETYFETSLYVPLVQRAHELWRELEETSGTSLMKITGGLMIGPSDGMVITGTLRSVREHRLAHEVLTPTQYMNGSLRFSSMRDWLRCSIHGRLPRPGGVQSSASRGCARCRGGDAFRRARARVDPGR